MSTRQPAHPTSRLPPPLELLIRLVVALVALAGCAGSAITSTLPASTPTRQQVCQGALDGGALQPATAVPGFADVGFPPQSFSTSGTTAQGGDGRFTIMQFGVCTYAGTGGEAAIRSFFAGALPGSGWSQATTFPSDGAYQAPCGDPYCWDKDAAPRYVRLGPVADRNNGYVTYRVAVAIPPTPPSCTPDPAGVYPTRAYDVTLPNTSSDLPAPPLTKDGVGSGGQNGNVTQGGYGGECSAGSAAAVDAFFTTELPPLGWTYGVPPASLSPCQTTGSQWWKGNELFRWSTDGGAGASGTFWGFGDCTVS